MEHHSNKRQKPLGGASKTSFDSSDIERGTIPANIFSKAKPNLKTILYTLDEINVDDEILIDRYPKPKGSSLVLGVLSLGSPPFVDRPHGALAVARYTNGLKQISLTDKHITITTTHVDAETNDVTFHCKVYDEHGRSGDSIEKFKTPNKAFLKAVRQITPEYKSGQGVTTIKLGALFRDCNKALVGEMPQVDESSALELTARDLEVFAQCAEYLPDDDLTRSSILFPTAESEALMKDFDETSSLFAPSCSGASEVLLKFLESENGSKMMDDSSSISNRGAKVIEDEDPEAFLFDSFGVIDLLPSEMTM